MLKVLNIVIVQSGIPFRFKANDIENSRIISRIFPDIPEISNGLAEYFWRASNVLMQTFLEYSI